MKITPCFYIIYCITSFIACLLFNTYFCMEGLEFTNSIWSVVLFVIMVILQHHLFKNSINKRRICFSFCFAGVISLFLSLGYTISKSEVINKSFMWIISVLIYAYFIGCVVYVAWRFLDNLEGNKESSILEQIISYFFKRKWLYPTIVLLICWLLAYIAAFPGNFVYDAEIEYNQLINGFTGDIPLLHSLLTLIPIKISEYLTGNLIGGVAVVVIAQEIFMAYVLAYMLYTLYNFGVSKVLIACSGLYFALFIPIQELSVTLLRDVLFAILITYVVTLVTELILKSKEFLSHKVNLIKISCAMAFALMSRNNSSEKGFFVILCGLCALLYAWGRKKFRKQMVHITIMSLLLYIIVQGTMSFVCKPTNPSGNTTYSSLIQQIAKVANFATLDIEDSETLRKFFPNGVEYYPGYSDIAKGSIVIADTTEFVEFWKKLGKEYPGLYLTSFLESSMDVWFPNTVIDAYNRAGIPQYEGYDKCYLSFGRSSLYQGTGIEERSKFVEKIYEFYRYIGFFLSFEKVPVVSMIFSIGFQFWLVVHAFCYLWYRKKYELLIPVGIVLVYCLINMFVPIVLFRYICALFLCSPFINVLIFNFNMIDKKEE